MTDKQFNVLIVDDTPNNLHLLTEILTQRGYKVRPAVNGTFALATAHKHPPDLILLDIMMPDLDGYQVCQALKANERTRDIPVIFISALHEVFDKIAAFNVGGVDYVTKPFQKAEVLARVETHLMIRQLQQELQQKNNALHSANQSLEEKVQLRTAELAEANEALKAEIEHRIQHQKEKDKLFELVSQQGEQLRNLTNWLLESQHHERQGLAQGLQKEIEQNITLLRTNLEIIQSQLPLEEETLVASHIFNAMQVLEKMGHYVEQVTTNLHQSSAQEQAISENPYLKLSTREREVLRLLAQGKSHSEIADLLSIATTTIHTYTTRIKRKLNIQNVSGLIKFALDQNLL